MVRLVTADDDPSVVAAPIAKSFYDYIIPRRAFAHSPGRYESWVDRMMRESVERRVRAGVPVFVAEEDSAAVGVAMLNLPEIERSSEAVDSFERFLREAGPETRAFFEMFFATVDPLPFPTPHVYVSMLGVDPAYQGRGYGADLLAAAMGFARSRPGCVGLCLETEVESNVAWYERQGFRVVATAHFDGVDVWAMHRPAW
ncbi:MAG: GNAT family N-acetyltransferase [Fimbriimonadaceae bacterium]|nr:GNAT family N-acetyltransferase [Fimbriimonadaceae bacterium]